MRLILLLFLLLPGWALAGPLPEAAVKRILHDPAGFVAQATRLIAGYGGAGGLSAEGLARHIAIEQAAARAEAWRGLLVADLDGDGAVTGAEADGYLAVLSARGRGGFLLDFTAADADGDGTATPVELRAAAAAAGEQAVPARDSERLGWVLAFDADGDGAVTLAELRRGVAALGGKS